MTMQPWHCMLIDIDVGVSLDSLLTRIDICCAEPHHPFQLAEQEYRAICNGKITDPSPNNVDVERMCIMKDKILEDWASYSECMKDYPYHRDLIRLLAVSNRVGIDARVGQPIVAFIFDNSMQLFAKKHSLFFVTARQPRFQTLFDGMSQYMGVCSIDRISGQTCASNQMAPNMFHRFMHHLLRCICGEMQLPYGLKLDPKEPSDWSSSMSQAISTILLEVNHVCDTSIICLSSMQI